MRQLHNRVGVTGLEDGRMGSDLGDGKVGDHESQDESASKEKSIFQIWNLSASSTLRSETYDEHKDRNASYSTISVEEVQASRTRKWNLLSFQAGWRPAVYGCIVCCMVSFWINLLLTVVVITKYGVDSSGRLTFYHGNCDTTKNLNTWIHVFINAMSTVILSSSNYVQQVLSAVTREEVDAAHEGRRRSRWADIGVPSMFNICLLDRRRVLLWYLLIFSSLPLHLL
jgi:hypothetical protein